MILAFAYETETGSKVPSDLVEEKNDKFYHIETGEELKKIVAKMSKSLKNVVNPDDVVKNFGADSLRLYEMFMGPLSDTKPWTENGVKGVHNFLQKVWKFFSNKENITEEKEKPEILKVLHGSIKKVGDDIENLRFNTGVSQLMILLNACNGAKNVNKNTALTYFKLLSPFAPHIAEELWELYGNKPSIISEEWPVFEERYMVENEIEYPVQFNGKLRYKIKLPANMDNKTIEKTIVNHGNSIKWLEGKNIVKFIVVPNRIINVVIK
jgi:leucyl-tRNA synthetase